MKAIVQDRYGSPARAAAQGGGRAGDRGRRGARPGACGRGRPGRLARHGGPALPSASRATGSVRRRTRSGSGPRGRGGDSRQGRDQVQPGDEVFGIGRGSFAEYACAREDKLAPKPSNLSFEQAAAVAISGLPALQGLRDHGEVRPGPEGADHRCIGRRGDVRRAAGQGAGGRSDRRVQQSRTAESVTAAERQGGS